MASFTHTRVDANRLSSAANNIENNIRLVENAIQEVENILNGRLRPTWTGEASNQFFAQQGIDAQSFASYLARLRELNEQLRRAAGVYDAADDAAGALVRRIRIGSGG